MINRKNLSQIKCIVAEVDGVLTDGKFWLNHQGHKQRKFSVRDSMAIRRLIKAGYWFAVISPVQDKEVAEHFEQLGVQNILFAQNGKLEFSQLFAGLSVATNECAIIRASDLGSAQPFGISATVPNAPHTTRTSVEHVTGSEGGDGAFAEFAQLILDHGSYSSHQMTTARKAAST